MDCSEFNHTGAYVGIWCIYRSFRFGCNSAYYKPLRSQDIFQSNDTEWNISSARLPGK
jgi:hypothetical protein